MAQLFPNAPGNLEDNPVYRFLLDDYRHTLTWSHTALVKKFGRADLDAVVHAGVLSNTRGTLKLTFNVNSTQANAVLRVLRENGIASSKEVKRQLAGRGYMVSTGRLKNTIAFLFNFDRIQYQTMPNCGITSLSLEHDAQTEADLDFIYKVSDHLEPQYVYHADLEAGLRSFADLGTKEDI